MTLTEDTAGLQIPQTVQISPNCQQVLWSTCLVNSQKRGDHPVSTLWLGETGKPKSGRQLTPGHYNDISPQWAPDGRSIAFISDRAKRGGSSAIYILPLDGGEAYCVTPEDAERPIAKFAFSPNGGSIAFLQANEGTEEPREGDGEGSDAQVPYDRIKMVQVATKKVATIVNHDRYCTDLVWSPDGQKIAWAEVPTPSLHTATDIRLLETNRPGNPHRTIHHSPTPVSNLNWAGLRLYFCATNENEDSKSIYSLDPNHPNNPTNEIKHEAYCNNEPNSLQTAKSDITFKRTINPQPQTQVPTPNPSTAEEAPQQQQALLILPYQPLFKTPSHQNQTIVCWHAAFTRDSDELVLALALAENDDNDADASTPEIFTTTSSGGARVRISEHGGLGRG